MTNSTGPVIQTWILNNDHSIATWVEQHAMIPYAAHCKCGWHSASASAGLRNWNVSGHAKDVLESPPHDPSLCGQCAEDEYRS